MPELPEVETIKRGLNKLIVNKTLATIDFDNAKSFPNNINEVNNFLIGATIVGIKRRAKMLIIEFDSSYSLLVHLKMTGQMVYNSKNTHFGAGHPNESLIGQLPDKSTRVIFSFTDKSKLFFNDQRKFGWIKLYPSIVVYSLDNVQKIGPEPLDSDFSWSILKERLLRRSKASIKPVLIDQSVIAGVGNIYADESLWGAKIHPSTRVTYLSDKDYKALHKSLIEVLTLSINKGGSTDRNFVNAEGVRGSYLEFARVFRRNGLPCPRCGHNIIKIKLAGRGTHFCPKCQIERTG